MQFTLAARRLFFVSIAAVSCCCCCSKCFFKALIQPRKETETKLKGDSRRLFYFILFYFILFYCIYFISLKEQKETKERQIKSSYALLRFGFAEFILHSFQRCCCCRLLPLLLLQLSDSLLEGSLSSPSHSSLMRTCKANPKP